MYRYVRACVPRIRCTFVVFSFILSVNTEKKITKNFTDYNNIRARLTHTNETSRRFSAVERRLEMRENTFRAKTRNEPGNSGSAFRERLCGCFFVVPTDLDLFETISV